RRRISPRNTIRPNTIPRLVTATVRIRATVAVAISIVEIAAETVVGADAGVEAEAAAVVVAEAGAPADLPAEICLHLNILRPKAGTAKIAVITKIAATAAVTIGAAHDVILEVTGRKAAGMASRAHRRRPLGRQKRSFCSRVNRLRNSAIALLLPRPLL